MEKIENAVVRRKINYEDFSLLKVKLKEYGADFHWIELGTSGGRYTHEFKELPHEDLVNALGMLKPFFAQRIGIEEAVSKIRKIIKDGNNLLLTEKILEIEVGQIERCNVSGISLSGTDNFKKLIIIGKIDVPVYGSYSIGAPGINLVSDQLGYEERVKELFEEVRKEAYNILFKGKKGPEKKKTQLDLVEEAEKMEIDREEKQEPTIRKIGEAKKKLKEAIKPKRQKKD